MSFENQNEKPKWPEAGSQPEIGSDVRYHAVEGSRAKRSDSWTVMGLTEQDGITVVEIWHSYAPDQFKKLEVPLEELRNASL